MPPKTGIDAIPGKYGMANILVEVSPKKPDGTVETIRMAHKSANSDGTQLNGFQWFPLITKRPSASLELMDGSGNLAVSEVKRGAVEFRLSPKFQNEVWSRYTWSGAPVKVWVGTLGDLFSSYVQIVDGTVSTISRQGELATVELLGPDAALDFNLLSATYGGTGGEEGPAGLKGNLKPWVSGQVINISPVLVDAAHWIYQVHGYGPVEAIPYVYEFGQALDPTKRKPNVQTFQELAALAMVPGEWAVCLPLGMFRIGGAPSRSVTADVVGATVGFAAPRSVGAIVPHLLSIAGVPAEKIGSFSAFNTAVWNVYLTEQATVGEVVRDAMLQAGGYLIATGEGVWRCGNFYAPQAAIPFNADRSSFPKPVPGSLKELNAADPVWKVEVGYDRVWTVLSDADVSPVLASQGQVLSEVIPELQSKLADFSEILDQIDEVAELIDTVREGGFAKAADLEVLGETALQGQMLAVNEARERINATHLNDVPLGNVVVNEITRTDDVIETVGLIAIKAADGQSVIFRTDKVMVANGVSIADKFEFMEAATEQAKADALTQITLTANDIRAAADLKFALITTFQDYQAQAQQQFSTLSSATESLAEFDAILGAVQPDGQSIRVNKDKVLVNATQTWAQSDTFMQSQFDGTATGSNKSFLLQSMETNATKIGAYGTILTQLGVTDLSGNSASAIDFTKVKTGANENLSQRLTSISSELSGKATSASVSSQISAATGPGSSLASSISTAQSTANGANSLASIAYSAANGNAADIGILTWVGDRATGIKVNGATRTLTIVADKFAVIPSSGGSAVVPFSISNGTVYMDNVVARNIGAGTITADKIVGGAVTNLIVNEYVGQAYFSTGEMEHLSFSYFCEGGKISLDVYCEIGTDTSSPAGAVYRLYCDGSVYNAGAQYCTPSWGQLGSTTPVVVNPGYGSHTFRVTYQSTPGSGSVRANRTYVRLTELKK